MGRACMHYNVRLLRIKGGVKLSVTPVFDEKPYNCMFDCKSDNFRTNFAHLWQKITHWLDDKKKTTKASLKMGCTVFVGLFKSPLPITDLLTVCACWPHFFYNWPTLEEMNSPDQRRRWNLHRGRHTDCSLEKNIMSVIQRPHLTSARPSVKFCLPVWPRQTVRLCTSIMQPCFCSASQTDLLFSGRVGIKVCVNPEHMLCWQCNGVVNIQHFTIYNKAIDEALMFCTTKKDPESFLFIHLISGLRHKKVPVFLQTSSVAEASSSPSVTVLPCSLTDLWLCLTSGTASMNAPRGGIQLWGSWLLCSLAHRATRGWP